MGTLGRSNTPDTNVEAAEIPIAVVGVGASAGGLADFRRFLRAMERESGLAFVLIQHLDPSHASAMAELLDKDSPLRVEEVREPTRVLPDRVYTIAPNTELRILDGVLHPSACGESHGYRSAIDVFLRTLAEDRRERSVGVILSGTGSDGTAGLKAIKGVGGMTLALNPEESEFDGMPRSAIQSDCVDYVLGAEEMGEAIRRCVGFLNARTGVADEPNLLVPASHERILGALATWADVDFRHYKPSTIRRRILRRMSLLQVDDPERYSLLVERDAAEARKLAQDLLVSVTDFFRDPALWQKLRDGVVPEIVENCHDGGSIRIWVPGCATGEEAYSYAMVFLEAMKALDRRCDLRIYATDIDDRAREEARLGIYPRGGLDEVDPQLRERYFARIDDHRYQVSKVLRDVVTFARQDLIGDPPYSRLNLISCRNILIYLQSAVQDQIIPHLHFALSASGFLVLGTAESVGRHSPLFATVSETWRIYRRTGASRHPQRKLVRSAVDTAVEATRRARADAVDLADHTRDLLTEHFQAAASLVDENGKVVYLRGNIARYFALPEGAPRDDLVELAPQHLRNRLRRGLRDALEKDEPVVFGDVTVGLDGEKAETRITIRSTEIPERSGRLCFVVFEVVPALEKRRSSTRREQADSETRLIDELEQELESTRDELQGTIAALGMANQELKASNEEVMSMNEELQSANEELETSKEELQSLNEELSTLNAQLGEQVSEVERSNNDLTNLLASAEVATIFLDRSLEVKRFTPAAISLVHLLGSDVGRPLANLSLRCSDPHLLKDASKVLETLQPAERKVRSDADRWYLRRILPYRTEDDRIDGVVVTFLDVTDLKRAQNAAENALIYFRTIGESIPFGVWMCDPEGQCTYLSQIFLELTGKTLDEVRGDGWFELLPPGEAEAARLAWAECVECHCDWEREHRILGRDGIPRTILAIGRPVTGPDGQFFGWVGLNLDITARKQSEEQLSDATFRLNLALSAAALGTHDFNVETGEIHFDERGCAVFGLHPHESLSIERFWEIVDPSCRAEIEEAVGAALDPARRTPYLVTYQIHPLDGSSPRWVNVSGRALFKKVGEREQAVRFTGTIEDVTEKRLRATELESVREEAEQANRAKTVFLANMSHDIRTPLTAVIGYSEVLADGADESQREIVDRISQACRQLLAILDSVLNLARLERGGTKLDLVRLEFNALVEQVCAMFAERARRAQIDLQLGLSSPSLRVMADPQSLTRVLMNLIDNALKYSEAGKAVFVDLQSGGEEALLVIRDEGRGMSKEFLSQLFKPFSQEREKQPDAVGGSGLGLAISKQLVDLMDGCLEFESEEGEGTTARLRFPLCAEEGSEPLEPEGAPAAETPQAATPVDLSDLRLLVCEDYPNTRRVLRLLLRDVEVDFAANADELWAELDGQDAILMDINLDGKDMGAELLDQLRAHPQGRQAKIIAFTAHNLPGEREAFLQRGFDGYLSKPFQREDLIRVLSEVMG